MVMRMTTINHHTAQRHPHPILGEDAAEQYDDLLSSSSSPSQKQGYIFVVYFSEDNHPCSIACNNEIDGRNDTIHITYPILAFVTNKLASLS